MKMTDEQKLLVENNLNLINKYMVKHHLFVDEYYDIFLVEICNAAIKFDPNLGYSFSTFAYKHFDYVVRNAINYNKQSKRNTDGIKFIFLDLRLDDADEEDTYALIEDNKVISPYDYSVCSCIYDDILSCCKNEKHRIMIQKRLEGYDYTEIGNMLNVSRSYVQREVSYIYKRYKEKNHE